MEMTKAADLYNEESPKKSAKRHEEYLAELNKALGAPSVPGQPASADPVATLEAMVANKSLSPDALGNLNSALAVQRQAQADIIKDVTLTSPLSSSFAAYDLEAPAKLLTPRPTPLRNRLPRKKGVGTSHRIKRITGYTGTGTGAAGGSVWPGITETSTAAFGSVNYERGPKISYTADDKTFPYNSYSLSDSVSFDANFSGLGYQDLRQLSSTSTLYATMLMEERMLLMARGTDSNYSGALAAPAITLTARAAATGETALGLTDKVYVLATSDAGIFGQSVLSGTGTATALGSNLTSGQVVDVTITSAVVGALGYRVYAVHGASDPGNTANWLQGTTSTQTYTIQGTLATSGTAASTVSADTSAYATGYDGILPTVLGPNSGYINRINTTFSTSNPGTEFQKVFQNLYNSVKADPDEVLMNGSDRKQLSDAIKSGSTANYRLNLTQTETGSYVGGAVIGALHNEITGKLVDLTVHPWLPQGVAPVLSYTLPIPDTEVSDVWAVFNVQDYMGIQWPVTQFSYDFSTYFRGTFVCYAPTWNGVVAGISPA